MTKPSGLKRKLRSRSKLFAGWTSLAHPSITEIFTRAGFDLIGIDLEHSTISQEQAQRIIAASQAGGVPCLPRVSSHNGEQIRRRLDSGADGVIVPNVSTLEQVERLVEWVKYPPVGRRGYGVSRAQGYGFDFDSSVKRWNRESVLLIQIESIEAVEAAEELLSHPEVDGVMVGPYDISGSLNLPGQISHPKVREAGRRVVEVCRKAGKACGTQVVEPDAAQVAAAFRAGYTLTVMASDVFLLWKWAQRMKDLRKKLLRDKN